MQKLKTIDADTLMTTPLPTTKFIVEGLLPEGVHILAGAPKIGKSWFALWLCLCVAKGEPVWDFPTKQGTVLYLCLEDSYARIQNRLFQITEDAPSTLHFANLAGSIGNGLGEQIGAFLNEHPQTVLIVIDTLQKIRHPSDASNPYASDYRDLGILKKLTDTHGIAILLIHHLRKMNDDDPLNMISGTTGISGAADSSFVLKPDRRGSDTATLYCTGRDIEYRELPLRFRKDDCTWDLLQTVEIPQTVADPTFILLSGFLQDLQCFEGTATQLSALLESQTGESVLPSVLSKKLVRYAGDLERAGIHFSASRTRDARLLHIRCDGNDGNDGKTAAVTAANYLSQPSQVSREKSHPLGGASIASGYTPNAIAGTSPGTPCP